MWHRIKLNGALLASGDFARTTTCGVTLAIAASCSISITFSPSAVGAATGSVVITSNAVGSPHTISLSGTGVLVAVTLDPVMLSFAAQGLGSSSAAQSVTLTSSGVQAWSLSSIGASGDFSLTNNCGGGLAVPGSCNINVTFKPTVSGTRTGVLTITSNAAGSPHTISLSGTGALVAVKIDPVTLSFAAQGLGSSDTQSVTLTSSGVQAWSLGSIGASGDFSQTNNCGGGLAVPGSCNISVTFKPTASGTRTGVLTIASNAAGSPHTVALSGVGGPPTAPGAPGIGVATPGNTSASIAFTAPANTGGSAITSYTATCGSKTGTGTASPITVTGLVNGTTYSCSVKATNSVGTSVASATVSVTPRVDPAPAVALSSPGLLFLTQTPGTTSAAQAVTLSNSGTAVLTIGSTAISAGGSDFAITNASTCGATLAASTNCTIAVTFSPSVAGTRTGTLSVTSNAPGSPHTVSLTGGGVTIYLDLAEGWNLLGNGVNAIASVPAVFGDPLAITTVWKWDAAALGWQFYAPSMNAAALQTYAASKGYGVLSVINGGEGFWVNSKQALSTPLPSGTAIAAIAFQEGQAGALRQGWNLISIGKARTPSGFNADMSAAPPASGVVPQNIQSLWAWDNPMGKWYFYAPNFEAQGGTALTDYIFAKGYLDFTATGKTLGPGVGFWVNKP